MSNLQLIFNIILFISIISIYTTMHPIYAVVLLVLIICQIAILMLLFNIEFLSFLLIIVYAGAIAVLFLFVVMMLNIKVTEQRYIKKFLTFVVLSCFIIIVNYLIFKNFFMDKNISFYIYKNNIGDNFSFFDIDVFNDIELLGQIIFIDYIAGLILLGLALLIPILGAVVLTFNCAYAHKKNFNNIQLSRSYNTTSFFK